MKNSSSYEEKAARQRAAQLGLSGSLTQAEYVKLAMQRQQEKDIKKAKAYYKVSSAALDIADATKSTQEFYQKMQKAAPKTVEESAKLEYQFAKQKVEEAVKVQQITSVTPLQIVGGEEKPMALSLLADIAKGALQAAKSPGVQKAVGGALTTVMGAMPTIGAPGKTYTVFRKNGRLVDMTTGRTLGYTPQAAKKKYKTRRRRRRWTQADERKMKWQAYMTAVAAGQPAVMPTPM